MSTCSSSIVLTSPSLKLQTEGVVFRCRDVAARGVREPPAPVALGRDGHGRRGRTPRRRPATTRNAARSREERTGIRAPFLLRARMRKRVCLRINPRRTPLPLRPVRWGSCPGGRRRNCVTHSRCRRGTGSWGTRADPRCADGLPPAALRNSSTTRPLPVTTAIALRSLARRRCCRRGRSRCRPRPRGTGAGPDVVQAERVRR